MPDVDPLLELEDELEVVLEVDDDALDWVVFVESEVRELSVADAPFVAEVSWWPE
jgi:hypothetical protein